MDPITVAAISGGTKLLGGLLGRDKGPSLRKQRNNMKITERQRYKWLVEGAQNAGFNPLSVLRATGGAMAPQLTTQTPLSARAILGEAIADFGGTFAQDAIQRATEQRENEEWRSRYDYAQATEAVPKLSANTKETAKRLEDAEAGIGERQFSGATGNFPQVDPYSSLPENLRVGSGPYQDRFVIAVDGGYYLTPKGMSPSGVTEETIGSLASELAQLAQLGKEAVNERGFERVHWNPTSGEVTGIAPKGKGPAQDYPGRTPKIPQDNKFQRQVGGMWDGSQPAFHPYNTWNPAIRLR